MADNHIRKTGIFGGAFNPVHNGHIHIAEEFKKELSLDRVIFIPTYIAPHKSSAEFASMSDRINMLSLALDGKDGFEISDIEFKRKGKSYTYDTLLQLEKLYSDDKFFLLIGADQLLNFDSWYKYEEILAKVTLCAAGRECEEEKKLMREYADNIPAFDKNRLYILSAAVLKVSSSQIRNRLKQGEDVSELMPKSVLQYINEKRIYIEQRR